MSDSGRCHHSLTYEIGSRVEVKYLGHWYLARVLEYNPARQSIFIHYEKWSSRYDAWINVCSADVRPIAHAPPCKVRDLFSVGDEVFARWSDGRMYPGVVTARHPDKDRYEVRYADGFVRALRASQISAVTDRTRDLYSTSASSIGLPPMTSSARATTSSGENQQQPVSAKRKRKLNPEFEQMMRQVQQRRRTSKEILSLSTETSNCSAAERRHSCDLHLTSSSGCRRRRQKQPNSSLGVPPVVASRDLETSSVLESGAVFSVGCRMSDVSTGKIDGLSSDETAGVSSAKIAGVSQVNTVGLPPAKTAGLSPSKETDGLSHAKITALSAAKTANDVPSSSEGQSVSVPADSAVSDQPIEEQIRLPSPPHPHSLPVSSKSERDEAEVMEEMSCDEEEIMSEDSEEELILSRRNAPEISTASGFAPVCDSPAIRRPSDISTETPISSDGQAPSKSDDHPANSLSLDQVLVTESDVRNCIIDTDTFERDRKCMSRDQDIGSPFGSRDQKTASPLVARDQKTVSSFMSRDQTADSPLVSRDQANAPSLVSRDQTTVFPLVSRDQTADSPLVSRDQTSVSPLVSRVRTADSPLVSRDQTSVSPLVSRDRTTDPTSSDSHSNELLFPTEPKPDTNSSSTNSASPVDHTGVAPAKAVCGRGGSRCGTRGRVFFTADEARTTRLPLGWTIEPIVEKSPALSTSEFTCSEPGCNKKFRKERLLQLHLKHYHGHTELNVSVVDQFLCERESTRRESSGRRLSVSNHLMPSSSDSHTKHKQRTPSSEESHTANKQPSFSSDSQTKSQCTVSSDEIGNLPKQTPSSGHCTKLSISSSSDIDAKNKQLTPASGDSHIKPNQTAPSIGETQTKPLSAPHMIRNASGCETNSLTAALMQQLDSMELEEQQLLQLDSNQLLAASELPRRRRSSSLTHRSMSPTGSVVSTMSVSSGVRSVGAARSPTPTLASAPTVTPAPIPESTADSALSPPSVKSGDSSVKTQSTGGGDTDTIPNPLPSTVGNTNTTTPKPLPSAGGYTATTNPKPLPSAAYGDTCTTPKPLPSAGGYTATTTPKPLPSTVGGDTNTIPKPLPSASSAQISPMASINTCFRSISTDSGHVTAGPRRRRGSSERKRRHHSVGSSHVSGDAKCRDGWKDGKRRKSGHANRRKSSLSNDALSGLDSYTDGSVDRDVLIEEEEEIDALDSSDVVNCLCGNLQRDAGLMIQCELCLAWQHGCCLGLSDSRQVPENYVCHICLHPRRQRRSRRLAWNQQVHVDGVAFRGAPESVKDVQYRRMCNIMKSTLALTSHTLQLRRNLRTLRHQLSLPDSRSVEILPDLHWPSESTCDPLNCQPTVSDQPCSDNLSQLVAWPEVINKSQVIDKTEVIDKLELLDEPAYIDKQEIVDKAEGFVKPEPENKVEVSGVTDPAGSGDLSAKIELSNDPERVEVCKTTINPAYVGSIDQLDIDRVGANLELVRDPDKREIIDTSNVIDDDKITVNLVSAKIPVKQESSKHTDISEDTKTSVDNFPNRVEVLKEQLLNSSNKSQEENIPPNHRRTYGSERLLEVTTETGVISSKQQTSSSHLQQESIGDSHEQLSYADSRTDIAIISEVPFVSSKGLTLPDSSANCISECADKAEVSGLIAATTGGVHDSQSKDLVSDKLGSISISNEPIDTHISATDVNPADITDTSLVLDKINADAVSVNAVSSACSVLAQSAIAEANTDGDCKANVSSMIATTAGNDGDGDNNNNNEAGDSDGSNNNNSGNKNNNNNYEDDNNNNKNADDGEDDDETRLLLRDFASLLPNNNELASLMETSESVLGADGTNAAQVVAEIVSQCGTTALPNANIDICDNDCTSSIQSSQLFIEKQLDQVEQQLIDFERMCDNSPLCPPVANIGRLLKQLQYLQRHLST